jgi:hypothetical protein
MGNTQRPLQKGKEKTVQIDGNIIQVHDDLCLTYPNNPEVWRIAMRYRRRLYGNKTWQEINRLTVQELNKGLEKKLFVKECFTTNHEGKFAKAFILNGGEEVFPSDAKYQAVQRTFNIQIGRVELPPDILTVTDVT